jgi:hypothetical protein
MTQNVPRSVELFDIKPLRSFLEPLEFQLLFKVPGIGKMKTSIYAKDAKLFDRSDFAANSFGSVLCHRRFEVGRQK